MTADVRTFKADSMSEALEIVRRELGDDAVILHTRQVAKRRLLPFGKAPQEVEITAGRGIPTRPLAPRATSPISVVDSGSATIPSPARGQATAAAAANHGPATNRGPTAPAPAVTSRPSARRDDSLAPPPDLFRRSPQRPLTTRLDDDAEQPASTTPGPRERVHRPSLHRGESAAPDRSQSVASAAITSRSDSQDFVPGLPLASLETTGLTPSHREALGPAAALKSAPLPAAPRRGPIGAASRPDAASRSTDNVAPAASQPTLTRKVDQSPHQLGRRPMIPGSANPPATALSTTATMATRTAANTANRPLAPSRPAPAMSPTPGNDPRGLAAQTPAPRESIAYHPVSITTTAARKDSGPTEPSPGELSRRLDQIERLLQQLTRQAPEPALADVPVELFQLFTRLIDADVEEPLARDLIGQVARHATPEQRHDAAAAEALVTGLVEKEWRIAAPITGQSGRHKTVALVGPTGVGKTTTIAKLAANFRLRDGLRTGLVTVDTYRIAAVEQLRTYAEIIDLPMKVVTSPQEMRRALDELSGLDLVLIDTAGRSPRDDLRISELKACLQEARADEIHLVLSAATAPRDLPEIAQQFAAVPLTAVILTKLDELLHPGNLLSIARQLRYGISHLTTGQDVPDDIESADATRLTDWVLGRQSLPI